MPWSRFDNNIPRLELLTVLQLKIVGGPSRMFQQEYTHKNHTKLHDNEVVPDRRSRSAYSGRTTLRMLNLEHPTA